MSFNTDRLKLELRRARIPLLQYGFLVAVFAFASVIFLRNMFYKSPLTGYRTYQVEFADAKGVNPTKQRVRIAGVDVGIVDGSRVGKDGHTGIVKIAIRKEYGKLYRNARVRLRPLTPLQDMTVAIESRGTPNAGELGSKDVIAARQTLSPVDISRVLNTFDTDTRPQMQVLLNELGKGLDGNGAQLRAAFAELAPFLHAAKRTTDEMKTRRTSLARLVTNLDKLTDALGDRDDQLASMIRRGNRTTATLAANQGTLDATLREIPLTLASMRSSFSALRATESELDPALRGLGPVTQKLESGLKALGRFGRDAEPTLDALDRPVGALRLLSKDLSPTSQSLARSFKTLQPQAPQLDHITSQILPCRDAMQDFFQQTLSVLKFSDAFGAYPRGDTIEQGDAIGGLGTSLNLKKQPLCTDGIK